jgi:hypothetical protein
MVKKPEVTATPRQRLLLLLSALGSSYVYFGLFPDTMPIPDIPISFILGTMWMLVFFGRITLHLREGIVGLFWLVTAYVLSVIFASESSFFRALNELFTIVLHERPGTYFLGLGLSMGFLRPVRPLGHRNSHLVDEPGLDHGDC